MSVLLDRAVACGITHEAEDHWYAWIAVGEGESSASRSFKKMSHAFRWLEECYAKWKSAPAE